MVKTTLKPLLINTRGGKTMERYDKKVALKYENPVVPTGYKHILGEWNTGFVIQRENDGSLLTWVPVGCLKANGTLDGVSFTEKFGRRKFLPDVFSEYSYHESMIPELISQVESIKKYEGFYISSCNISKNKITGKPQSVKGELPWTNINFPDAKLIASEFEMNDDITSHLTFGAEYDSLLEWLIQSGVKPRDEITKDSTKWGNYWNSNHSSCQLVTTGSQKSWEINNICDLAGNVDEWTQEEYGKEWHVIRGGSFSSTGNNGSAAQRFCYTNQYNYICTGYRIVLTIR